MGEDPETGCCCPANSESVGNLTTELELVLLPLPMSLLLGVGATASTGISPMGLVVAVGSCAGAAGTGIEMLAAMVDRPCPVVGINELSFGGKVAKISLSVRGLSGGISMGGRSG